MITDSFDIDTEPMFTLKDFYGEQNHFVEKCFIVISKEIHDYLLNEFSCEIIGYIGAANGKTPIFMTKYEGINFAFYLTQIGSALASGSCAEANWITGANKFIMCGSCGSLNKSITNGKYIVPTEAYRGEGASYYYAKASDYIRITNSQEVISFFENENIPYVKGKVWTTDSMLRETRGLINRRKEEGCIAVEMELAGVQAVCDFYHFDLYNFLEAGDVLEESGYELEELHRANHHLGKLFIGLKLLKII
ncbi:nucleoside phosphorylase [Facklamia sp. DSM 111018]|uniref:Uridine phosphorylase n=1 Tax=Facklamia lactis TaxID=2749967 RepID=A0ABS0LQ29_9LACT|nr:nucleoside phosphorylase [Facklamia lactis]MBG9979906.1 nucleoside phosphorylase [Facklamia lactis]MBG9985414.1 nucleoside phosphorylase [Facklamia lactis]